jgi:hypothetical protein
MYKGPAMRGFCVFVKGQKKRLLAAYAKGVLKGDY